MQLVFHCLFWCLLVIIHDILHIALTGVGATDTCMSRNSSKEDERVATGHFHQREDESSIQ